MRTDVKVSSMAGGFDAAKSSVLVGPEGLSSNNNAGAVAHFYKTRSLIVYSKKHLNICISHDNVRYNICYIAMQTRMHPV